MSCELLARRTPGKLSVEEQAELVTLTSRV
jgi:hypothetical protein